MHRWLILLSFCSGICGIAYEVLYARLLSTYLGDMFYVVAAILASFLASLALGAMMAHRYVRHLWRIETILGVYALLVSVVAGSYPAILLHYLTPLSGGQPVLIILVVWLLLLIPAMLVGFSVPLFTIYLQAQQPLPRARGFQLVYSMYNLGAALCVLLIEYGLLRSCGVSKSLACMGLLNLLIGWALRFWRVPANQPTTASHAPVAVLGVLFIVGALSGIYQLLFLKFAQALFGPYHENFALVLAIGLVSLSVGTWLVSRWHPAFGELLLAGSVALALAFAALGPLIHLWGYLNQIAPQIANFTLGLKIFMLLAIGAVPLTVFGATVPCLMAHYPGNRATAGLFLGICSLGNCVGYLSMILLLYELLSYQTLALLITGVLGLAGLLLARGQQRAYAWTSVLLGVLLLLPEIWPVGLLDCGYMALRTPHTLAKARQLIAKRQSFKKYGCHVTLVHTARYEYLVIDGYNSMGIWKDGRSNLREMLFGTLPALYAPARKNALVLGTGTGITAGAAQYLFERVTAVDINPVMLALLPHFGPHNHYLTRQPNVRLVLADGLTALARGRERYDAIINTVTSPLFFSSSKLYTRDFFQLVARRLKPGGVYAMWFDSRVGNRGTRIIFQTLRQSFRACHFVFLNKGYLQVICSLQPLKLHSLPAAAYSPLLRRTLRANGITWAPEIFLPALLITHHRLFSTDWQAPVNTFDYPVLEFTMSSLAINSELFHWRNPYKLLGVRLLPKNLAQADQGALQRLAALQALGEDHGWQALRRAHNGCLPAAYIKLAAPFLVLKKELLPTLLQFVADLVQQGDHAAARTILAQIQAKRFYTQYPAKRAQRLEETIVRLQLQAAATRAQQRLLLAQLLRHYLARLHQPTQWPAAQRQACHERLRQAVLLLFAAQPQPALRLLSPVSPPAAARPPCPIALRIFAQSLRIRALQALGQSPVPAMQALLRLDPFNRYLRQCLASYCQKHGQPQQAQAHRALRERLGPPDATLMAIMQTLSVPE